MDSGNVPDVIVLLEVESDGDFIDRQAQTKKEVHRKLNWTPSAMKFLGNIPQDVMAELRIISILGKSRGGKSTMLTLLIKHLDPAAAKIDSKSKLFEVGHGHDTVTEGMWLYPKVLWHGGKPFLLIDTEGTQRGSDQLTSQVTAVACFLSSLTILLVDRGISNTELEALNRMQSIVSMASNNAKGLVDLMPDLLVLCGRTPARFLVQEGLIKHRSDVATVGFGSKGFTRGCDRLLYKQLDPALHKADQEELNNARRVIRESFPRIYSQITTIANEDDEVLLEECRLQPEEDSVFARSVVASLRRLVNVAPAKRFGGMALTPHTLSTAMAYMLHQVSDNPLPIRGVLFFMHLDRAVELIAPLISQMVTEIHADIANAKRDFKIEDHIQTAKARVKETQERFVAAMYELAIVSSAQSEAIERFHIQAEQAINCIEGQLRDAVIESLHQDIHGLQEETIASKQQHVRQLEAINILNQRVVQQQYAATQQKERERQLQESLRLQALQSQHYHHVRGGHDIGCSLL